MTYPSTPASKCLPFHGEVIPARFEIQALLRSTAPALTLEGDSLSYGEVNGRANQIAGYLRELGVGPNVLVGIHLDRSFDLVVGILAILKAGGAYLPLDLACPEERLNFFLKDSGAHVVLTEARFATRFAEYAGKIICLDQEADQIADYSPGNLPALSEPQDLAYVIYTSGSTGTPKGVCVTQENVVRLFGTTNDWFHFGTNDVWTLFHSSAFDFSVWEIFGALFFGGRLVIVPYMVSRSANAFRELIEREKVTVLNQTPSAFRQLIQADLAQPPAETSLRYVIFGGEALEVQNLRPWFERHGDQHPQCINMYGITETTVHVTYHPITLADLAQGGSNIGTPLPDLQVYIVNEAGQLAQKGEAGEMLVGGAGVAQGYFNRPDLTRERFIQNTFDPSSTSLLYRSGDLARERKNGELEYLGRSDYQVKIRGFRIELHEIEAALARHPSVRECVVLSRTDEGQEARLIAYVVTTDASSGVEALRDHLAQTLPDYMIPAAFVFLAVFPLTINGKLDRAALPLPGSERPQLAATFIAPHDELEKMLARLWQNVLRQDVVGSDDNFFDLGGDSLLLTTLHRQLQDKLKREISITDLFQFPTIRSLAGHLGSKSEQREPGNKIQTRAQRQRAVLARARPGEAGHPLAA